MSNFLMPVISATIMREKISKLLSVLIISLLVSLLSGCGFHLKGLQDPALQNEFIYPVYENTSANFRQEFQQLLIENNQQAISPESATIKIRFLKEKCQRQSLTVSDTGIPVEYRLSCTISYTVSNSHHYLENGLEKYHEITESRDFKSNNSQLLAVDSQQALLKNQIQQRISRLILNYLR